MRLIQSLLLIALLFQKFVVNYRKIPKITPSKYKRPKPVTQKTLRYIAPPNISPPGACTWKIVFKYKGKQSKNGKFIPNIKLAKLILKHKFPSVDKPLQKYAPQKGTLKNISPGAYFRNFMVFHLAYSWNTQHEQLHAQLIQQSLIIVFHFFVDTLVFSY